MPRTRRLPALVVAVVLLLCSTSAQLSAIGPFALLFYGGDLTKPILIRPGNPSMNPTDYLWSPVHGGVRYGTVTGGTVPKSLEGRPYVSHAIFWGAFDDDALKPANASQHGRIYLPTASEPAVIVVTWPRMANATGGKPEPFPIPRSLEEFNASWTLKPDLAVLRDIQAALRK